jgi:hypothetical protein
MARQQTFSPFQSFVAGREARQQYDLGETRNKLAELQLADEPAQMQRRNALADVQLQGAQVGLQSAQQQLSADQAKFAYAKLKQAADSGNPKAFIAQQIPDLAAKLQQQGIDINSMDDQSVAQLTDNLARKYAGEAGIAPTAPEAFTLKPGEQRFRGGKVVASAPANEDKGFTLSAGETRFGPDGKPLASIAPKLASSRFRALTAQEVAAAGLPAGTSAQIDEATGKIDVLSKKDTTATLSQKDATVAKIKLNQLKVAKQQLQNVRNKFAKIKGTMSAGKGQGWVPSEAGEAFDKAVDSMKGSLTAITRVPGVGSMSDYESRIDQSKFPKRGDYESVTDDQIAAIEDLLTTIESGYTDLLGGGSQPAQAAPPSSPSPSREVTATGPNGQKIILRNGQWEPL